MKRMFPGGHGTSRLASNFGWSLASKLVSLGANFGYVVTTARLYSKQEVAVLAVAAILTVLMDVSKGLGLGTLLLKKLPKMALGAGELGTGEKAAPLVLTYLVYSLVPPLVLAVAAAAGAGALSQYFFGSPMFRAELEWGAWIALLVVMANTNILVFQAVERFRTLGVLTVATSVLQRLAPPLAASVARWNLSGFLEASVALSAAACLVTFLPLGRLLIGGGGLRLVKRAEFWPQARHFYYTGLLRYMATQVDQLLVAALFAPATLAVYFMLRRLYSMAVVMIASMIDALVPDLSREAGHDEAGAQHRLEHWLGLSLYAGTVGGSLLAGNGEIFINWILGPGYADDELLVILFAVSALTYFLFGFIQMGVVLFEQPRLSLELAGLTALVNSIAALVGALLVGVRGLPLAMSASYVAGLWLVRRRNPETGNTTARLALGIFVIAAAGLVSLGLQAAGWTQWMRLAVVNLGITGFAWVHYSRWQVRASLRRLASPVRLEMST